MDLDNIKEMWEKHCKEHGFIGHIINTSKARHEENRYLKFIVECNHKTTQVYCGNSIIYNFSNTIFELNIKSTDAVKYYKLFTIFYEKLMEQK